MHLSPGQLALDDAAPAPLRLTIACGPQAAAGTIELAAPDGVRLEPAGPLPYDLPPLGHLSWDLTVQAAGMSAGRGFVTAQIAAPCGQVIEDSALLTIGQPGPPSLDQPLLAVADQQQAVDAALVSELDLSLATRQITLRPGEASPIEVRLVNRCGSAIRGEAQLLSPHGSWHQAGPWTTGFSLPAGASSSVRFAVAAPATARRGERWWVIVKVMYFGRLRYTDPVEVTIRGT